MTDVHKQFNQMMTCAEFDRYMDAMREEVAKHKWYLSEQAGRDVGELFAFEHWSKNHRDNWQKEWHDKK